MRRTRNSIVSRRGSPPGRFGNWLAAPIAILFVASFGIADEGLQVVAPSLGRPAFVAPGGDLAILAAGLDPGESVEANLIHPRVARGKHALERDSHTVVAAAGGPLHFRIPSATPARTYDLELRARDRTTYVRHCVAVGQIGSKLRILHLSDMNVGDIQSPNFDRRIIAEANLWSPDVIVGSGDFLDAAHPQPDTGWTQLVDFLCDFDAPLILASGEHDDAERFARHLCASPIGTVECGPFQFVVLNDHNLTPLTADAEQIRWAEQVFAAPPPLGTRIGVANAPSPALLMRWFQNGQLRERLKSAQLAAWIAGGAREPTPGELGDLIAATRPLRIVRTAAASGSVLAGADGAAHYRVFDLLAAKGDDNSGGRITGDWPCTTGRISVQQAPAISNPDQLDLLVTNNADCAISSGAAWIRIPKRGDERPWANGARLAATNDLGNQWECRLIFDLPARAALRARVGTGPPPAEPSIDIHVDAPSRLAMAPRFGADGLIYWVAADAQAAVTLTHRGGAAITCRPLVRLDGDVIAWKAPGAVAEYVATAGLTLAPGASVRLQLDLSAVRVRPGPRELVFYLNDGTTLTPIARPIDVIAERGRAP